MSGALLLLPFLCIRFGLLSILNADAVTRAAHFAPMYGKEQIAYWVYQLSTAAIFVGLFFLRVPLTLSCPVILGWVVYLFGLVLCSISIVDFSAPSPNGLHQDGIYRFSRNPMYLSYLICFLGMALLTQSMFLFSAVILFQISAHWIILAEERWCSQTFGDLYEQYKRSVTRYI